MLKTTIYIYDGPGTNKYSIFHIKIMVNAFLPQYPYQTIGPKTVCEGEWKKDCKCFIMPGGGDIFYMRHLSPEGNKHIKEYVSSGGIYMGICAGAYYAGENLIFHPRHKKEALGQRELGFFPGTVYGPILKEYFYNSEKGAMAAPLSWNNILLKFYYNGGGFFVDNNNKNIEVIANYKISTVLLPAIIQCNVQQGKAILSGVHFECDYRNMPLSNPSIINELKPFEELRIKFLRELFKRFE